MASLDLSDLLDDDEFATPCTLVQRTRTGTDHGRPVVTEDRRSIAAVIQPATPQDLALFDVSASGVVSEALAIYSPEPLTAGHDGGLCDQVIFGGVRYDVLSVEDWTPNGRYVRAVLQRVGDDD